MGLQYSYTVQIRDTTAHNSDVMADETGVTVVSGNLHTNQRLGEYTSLRVYVADTHDVAFDVTIEHTAGTDPDYQFARPDATLSLTAGESADFTQINGPIGRLRFRTETGGLTTAPTTGELTVTVVAVK